MPARCRSAVGCAGSVGITAGAPPVRGCAGLAVSASRRRGQRQRQGASDSTGVVRKQSVSFAENSMKGSRQDFRMGRKYPDQIHARVVFLNFVYKSKMPDDRRITYSVYHLLFKSTICFYIDFMQGCRKYHTLPSAIGAVLFYKARLQAARRPQGLVTGASLLSMSLTEACLSSRMMRMLARNRRRQSYEKLCRASCSKCTIAIRKA